jgi:RNA polymerase sigma factor (sigma-70 family)
MAGDAISAAARTEELTRRFLGLVYRAAVRRSGGEGRGAEDITQAVFLIVLQKARTGGLPEESHMAGWLLKITYYAARQARRSATRRSRHERSAASSGAIFDVTAEAADLRIESRELLAVLDDALLKLAAPQRELLVRRYLQGQSLTALAAALCLSENAASQRLHRAMEKLRKMLGRQNLLIPAAALAGAMLGESTKAAPFDLMATTSGNAAAIAKGATTMLKLSAVKAAAVAAGLFVILTSAASFSFLYAAGAPPAGPMAQAPATATAPAVKPSEQLTRIREQIYILRNSVVFIHAQQTYAAVRELVSIGKPAVPELCNELHRLDNTHDGAFRTVAFTLRIIGDPRAVPALIDALPKTVRSSDCEEHLYDRDLCNFVNSHNLASRPEKLKYPTIFIPRADREIIDALNSITGHTVSDSFNYSADDTDLWHAWWLDHWREFTTREEANSVLPPEGKDDPVAAAGLARFGPLFPTGPKIRVGPVREVALDAYGGWDSKTEIDFDTNSICSVLDRDPATFGPYNPENPPAAWASGVDAACITYSDSESTAEDRNWICGYDLEAWRIDNARWNSIESEIHSGKTLDLGKAGRRSDFMLRFSDIRTQDRPDVPPATFLFITREGGHGIIQILGSYSTPPSVKFRYRMFEDPDHPAEMKKKAAPPAARPELSFGPEIKVTLGSPESKDACALDLDTGEKHAAEDGATEEHSGDPAWIGLKAQTYTWLSKWHGDIIVQPQFPGDKLFCLQTVDVAAFTLSEPAWSNVNPARLVAIFAYREPKAQGFMSASDPPARSVIWAFKTREGAIGLLQVLEGSANPQSLTLRYRLIKGLTPADTQPASRPAATSSGHHDLPPSED